MPASRSSRAVGCIDGCPSVWLCAGLMDPRAGWGMSEIVIGHAPAHNISMD